MQFILESKRIRVLLWAIIASSLSHGQDLVTDVVDLSAFTVYAGSSMGYAAPAGQLSDRMSREVRVDLQSRGGSRYQNDISIRGGIFEGTGLMVGGMTLFDPQTGHYFSEIPLDPSFFGGASLLTGVANGINGFNSTAGSIDWQWAPIESGGRIYARGGSNGHYGGGIQTSDASGNTAYQVAVSHEQGDGSIENGDFELSRISGRFQYTMENLVMHLFGGYLDKFYGWPGMYTGFALNETDDYAVSLLGWQMEYRGEDKQSYHRVGGYWRQVDDDYEFRREQPNAFFEHQTEVFSLQGDGLFMLPGFEALYNWTWISDRINRSTSLVNGDFLDREYGKAALLGRKRWQTSWGEWHLYGGAAMDSSSEDSTVGLPQAGLRAIGTGDGITWSAYLEFAETSQVPGYTVLNSAESGLFGGNPDLGRERASTVEAGYSFQGKSLAGKMVLFQRKDDDLADWVYSSGSPSARQASPVDIDVTGLEGWLRWEAGASALELGYAWLKKDEDYGDSSVDASFYALNFARHRFLVTLEQQLHESVLFRLEAEYREHPDNVLRAGGADAFRVNAELGWQDVFEEGWDLFLRGNNLTEDDFQTVPGTAAPGREVFLTLIRRW